MRFISLLLVVAALRVNAGMVRVVAVEDGRTITVERAGARERVRLAGVAIIDDGQAREVLRWTALNAWVMLEQAESGEFLVYRSPDALLVNRELVLRGAATATLPALDPAPRAPARYLGTIDPPPGSAQRRVSEPRPPKTDSGTSRRSPGSPSRRGPRRTSRSAG